MKYWTVLESKKDYEEAMARVDELMDKNPGQRTDEGKELKLLLVLVQQYEEEHFTIDAPDPIEAIKIRMEDLGLFPKDLVEAIGDKGTVSKVLNRKLPLSLRMIRNLSKLLNLPADVLLKEFDLKAA